MISLIYGKHTRDSLGLPNAATAGNACRMMLGKFNRSRVYISKIYVIIAVMLMCITVTVDFQSVLASETVRFSANAIPSDKQVNKNVSYFDLMLSPGEEHVLEVDIFNNDEIPMVASVAAYTAGTNSSGVIEYDNINTTDDSLKVSFAEITTIDNPLISVPAAGSSRARITVKMPDIMFDGVILGGIVIKKADTPDPTLAGEGTSIQNEYCYVIAAKIAVSDAFVEPDFSLRSVEPALSNYHTNIVANLQNHQAAIAKDIKIDAQVYYNNSPDPIYTNSSEDFNVAPNSNFSYLIPCSGKLSAGDYRLLLTAAHEDRTWEFNETFSITAPVAKDINDIAVNTPGINYYLIATVVLLLLLIILVAVIIWMNVAKRKNKPGESQ